MFISFYDIHGLQKIELVLCSRRSTWRWVSTMHAERPDPENVQDDDPLRLHVAAAFAFPDGSMTASGLRRESKRGNLEIERVAGKDYTTLRAIKDMRKTPPRRLAWVEATAEPLPCGTARPTWDVSWFGWKGPFLRPGLTIPRRRAQPRSRMAEGDRACAARSVLDGGEHDARLDQGGPIEGTRRARA